MNEYQDQATYWELVMWSHSADGYVPVGPHFSTREDADEYADRWFTHTQVETRRRRGLPEGS